ncbi:MAG: hypothetical protein DHS20C11_23830 [Lysobacteraceae bacterium]|nr:MAG: hypothetical protein DHS20C11_23830 [Xanthomonadaceae bacterium]
MINPTAHPARHGQQPARLYFIHIPKCAGTTLVSVLERRFAESGVFPAQLWEEAVPLGRDKFGDYQLYRGHFGGFGLDGLVADDVDCITMLRDPIRRAASAYRFIQREPNTRLHQIVVDEGLSFEQFVVDPRTRGIVSNALVRNLSFRLRMVQGDPAIFQRNGEQARAALKAPGDRIPMPLRLARAIDRIATCRLVGLVSKFEESMALLSYQYRWPPVGKVAALRAADGPELEQLDPATLQALRQLNKEDLKLYRFAARLVRARIKVMMSELSRYVRPGETMPDCIADNPQLVHHLLDRHYQSGFRAESVALPKRIDLKVADPLSGWGWHGRERSGLRRVRWSGPGCESVIDLRIKPAALRLDLKLGGFAASSVAQGMRLDINGHTADVDWQKVGSKVSIDIPLAWQNDDGFLRLRFITASTARVIDKRFLTEAEIDRGFAFAGLTVQAK